MSPQTPDSSQHRSISSHSIGMFHDGKIILTTQDHAFLMLPFSPNTQSSSRKRRNRCSLQSYGNIYRMVHTFIWRKSWSFSIPNILSVLWFWVSPGSTFKTICVSLLHEHTSHSSGISIVIAETFDTRENLYPDPASSPVQAAIFPLQISS